MTDHLSFLCSPYRFLRRWRVVEGAMERSANSWSRWSSHSILCHSHISRRVNSYSSLRVKFIWLRSDSPNQLQEEMRSRRHCTQKKNLETIRTRVQTKLNEHTKLKCDCLTDTFLFRIMNNNYCNDCNHCISKTVTLPEVDELRVPLVEGIHKCNLIVCVPENVTKCEIKTKNRKKQFHFLKRWLHSKLEVNVYTCKIL